GGSLAQWRSRWHRRIVVRSSWRFSEFVWRATLSLTRGRRHRERLVAHRQSLHIGREGGDLLGIVRVLEGRHARRAVADDLADRLLAAAGAVLVELGSVETGDEGRPRVAHAAR